jgi:radical SAM modification target selenobiotic family peptide
MDSQDLKKLLAGFSIVTLLGGAAVTSGCAHGQSS